MPQRALPFRYAEENTSTGMTSLSGLPAYVDMTEVSGLVESVRTHMIVREVGQGWTDAQMAMSLILLNIAGGECVDDLRVLEKDEGLGRVLRSAETHRMRRGERRAHQRRTTPERSLRPSLFAAYRKTMQNLPFPIGGANRLPMYAGLFCCSFSSGDCRRFAPAISIPAAEGCWPGPAADERQAAATR